jgi:hypothetical protein
MTNARLLERITLFLIKDIYNFPDLDYKRGAPFKGTDERSCIIPQHTPHFIPIARQKRRS